MLVNHQGKNVKEEITKLKKYIIFFIIMTMNQKYCSILETLIIPQFGKKYITRDLYVNNPSRDCSIPQTDDTKRKRYFW
jgi:hypothetical protein